MTRVIPPHRRDPDDSHDSQYYRRGVDDIRNVITSTTEPLGAEPGTLWYNPEGVPDYGVDIGISKDDADELYTSKDEFAAVADVPPRVEAVEQTTERLDTQRFDSRSYPSLNAAIDAAHAAGGGEVFVADPPPDGVDIVLKDKVYLVGRGVGVTSFRARTIVGDGSTVALPALATDIPRHARAVTFSSAPDLVPGDVFILSDSADGSFSTARDNYRAGEFCRVRSVSGATVHLTHPTYAAYTAGGTVSAAKMTPIRTGISGMTIRGTTGQYLIRVNYGTDLVFRDLDLSGSNVSHLALSRCYNVDIADVRAFDAQAEVALNYGISIMNSQRIRVRGVDMETQRHGLVTGGDNAPHSVPVRDLIVGNSRIAGLSSTAGVMGCNLHGNAEDVTFDGVSMPAGVTVAGDRVTVRNCTIGTAANGTAIVASELLGASFTIADNTITANANHTTTWGMARFLFTDTCTRTGGTLVVKDNHFDLGPYNPASVSFAVLVTTSANSAPAGEHHLVISGNTIQSETADTNTVSLCRVIPNATGPITWRRIEVTNNTGNAGIMMESIDAPVIDLSGNTFTAAKGRGISMYYAASPTHTNPVVLVRNATVVGAQGTPLYLRGTADLIGTVIVENCTMLDGNQAGNTGIDRASMYLFRWNRVIRRQCVIGDRQAVPTLDYLDSLNAITEVIDEDTEALGSVTNLYRNGVGTYRFSGRGAGAPTMACADGSTYLRTDGGAGNTLYVREGGAWVAK